MRIMPTVSVAPARLLMAAAMVMVAAAAAAAADATAAPANGTALTKTATTTASSSSPPHHPKSSSCLKTVPVDPVAARAPLAAAGEKCGPYLAVCEPSLCCSQAGFCGAAADGFSSSCGTLCQCSFSGAKSPCRGRYPPPLPKRLPVARGVGSPCGAYVARCPAEMCCTEQSVCAPSTNAFCLSAGCQPDASGPDGGACAAAAALHPSRVFEKTLVLSWIEAAPDGYSRQWIGVNGRFPADNLRVDVGDRLVLTVVNNLGIATALHSHGFVQRRTAPSDGVATVTQRPIPPGEAFVYNFVADAPGTYWMHAHQKTQEMDGFRFAVVVGDPAEQQQQAEGRNQLPPLYYAKGVASVRADEILTLADLYHQPSAALVQWYLSPASGGNEPVPQGAILDGVSQAPGCAGDASCTYRRVPAGPAPVACPAGGAAEPAGVASSFATLLRVVNMAGMAVFRLSVDGHRLRVVAADSTPVEDPRLVRSVVVNAAQRYDLLLCREEEEGSADTAASNTQPAWIRAEMVEGIFYKEPERPLVLGVLVYGEDDDGGSLPPEPVFPAPPVLPTLDPLVPEAPPSVLNPQRLVPAGAGTLLIPPKATRTVRLVLDFQTMKRDTQYAVFNNVSFTFEPSSPSLMERYYGTPPGPPPKPEGTRKRPAFGFNVIEVRAGDVVDVVIDNLDTGEHPIHLHGVDGFWVTRYGAPSEGNYAPGKGLAGRVARDTETVNLESFLKLRYVAANKGSLFIMHCHITFHLAAGLATVFRTV